MTRTLLRLAETRAKALNKPRVTLGCRVELTHNHALFLSEGYIQTHTKSHEGYDRPTSLWFEKRVTPMDDTPDTPDHDDARGNRRRRVHHLLVVHLLVRPQLLLPVVRQAQHAAAVGPDDDADVDFDGEV